MKAFLPFVVLMMSVLSYAQMPNNKYVLGLSVDGTGAAQYTLYPIDASAILAFDATKNMYGLAPSTFATAAQGLLATTALQSQIQSDWTGTGLAAILNKPTLATVATSGSYGDLSGRPSLAVVATTGAYLDLIGRPVIPSGQVNTDWNATSGIAQLLNKPTLASVATSGAYSDLSSKPTLGTAASQNSTAFATSAQGTKADTSVQSGVAPLSVSGTVMSLAAATISVSGSMSASDKSKLDGMQTTRVQTDASGNFTWTYPIAYGAGVVPRIEVVVETATGTTDVVNAQVNGTPTNTSCVIKVNRTNQSVVALLGLTILSVPTSVGAQWIHITSRAP